MAQRLDRIGELLAKGVFLCLEKEKEKATKGKVEEDIKNSKAKPADPLKKIKA